MNCPSCKSEFIEHRDTAYLCSNCGWMQCIDGKWITIPEPAKISEPERKPEPKPVEPDNKPKENIRSYFGGLFTVTTNYGVPD